MGLRSNKPPTGECVIETMRLDLDKPHGSLRVLRADERIRIADALLENIDHPDVSYGDGILTIRAINGTVSYGVGPLDLVSMTHEGVRSPLGSPKDG